MSAWVTLTTGRSCEVFKPRSYMPGEEGESFADAEEVWHYLAASEVDWIDSDYGYVKTRHIVEVFDFEGVIGPVPCRHPLGRHRHDTVLASVTTTTTTTAMPVAIRKRAKRYAQVARGDALPRDVGHMLAMCARDLTGLLRQNGEDTRWLDRYIDAVWWLTTA